MYPIYRHGSEDSLDDDAYIILDSIPTFQEAKRFCDSQKELNANVLVIEDNKVIWSFKGTEDECNNSLIKTYHLHKQECPLPDIQLVERDLGLKTVRTIRGLLSYFSKTNIRSTIKQALRSDSFFVKLEALKECRLSFDIDYKKTTHVEVFKFFAFQIGQTLALIESQEELFTKKEVADKYPDLEPFLYRQENVDVEVLQRYFERFIHFIESHIELIGTQYHFNHIQQNVLFSFEEKGKEYARK